MSFDGRPYGVNIVSSPRGVMVGSYPNFQSNGFSDNAVYGTIDPGLAAVFTAIDLAAITLGTYHGYKRNHGSIGWAIGWAAFGAVLPILALPIMFAEGFAEPAPP